MAVLVLHVTKGAVIEVDVISIEKENLIVDSRGAVDSGELGREFNPPLYIHITGWCVVDCPVQWNAEVDIVKIIDRVQDSYEEQEF